ncbi:MAG TPA: hypothetical protein VJ867_15240 [Gemmatimonadaceae bacterium]|nr:hypothetical protein [Gemmatimonadaceae bacterium]
MNDYLRPVDPDRDEDHRITAVLRRLYAAPSDTDYWVSLEARILSRLTDAAHEIGWWEELDRWLRPALVAAAVVLLAAGIALFREYQFEQRVAYDAMLTPAPAALPVETAVRPVLQESKETTFRYLMTP